MLLALHAARPERYPVLLESTATGGTLGRYSILMACPGQVLEQAADGSLTGTTPVLQKLNFLDALDEWWGTQRLPPDSSPLPFTGGWFLYLSYELAGQIEPSLRQQASSSVPIATALRIPAALVLSHATGEGWLVAEAGRDALLDLLRSDLDDLSVRPPDSGCAGGAILKGVVSEEAPERFLQAVRTALEHIAAGNLYQANLSRSWRANLADGVRPFEVYRRLRDANPAPFAGLAVLGKHGIVSSSPERLVEVRGQQISTRPIAGTRRRGTGTVADQSLARELRRHPKEQAEHVMLIDLERNDLGRVCKAGTVEVDEYMSLESYAHVHHIVSNVRGTLRSDVTPGQVIAAVFPGGTITGCPKVRCMQLISELEREPRAVYTGSMGYLNRDGSMDLNILIRTFSIADGQLVFRAGAGIVADSDPEHELDETRAKAQGMLNALLPMECNP
ncbi:MAG: aminodeoxychorismate synthase component I [Steroidobacteraceae bacterium]